MLDLDPKRKKETLTLIAVFVGVLLASALAVYFLAGSRTQPEASRQAVQQSDREPVPEAQPGERRASQPSGSDNPFLGGVSGASPRTEDKLRAETWGQVLATLVLRLLLAALLGAALAFRPRRSVIKRNIYVAQTQILLAVVASALMIIVGDNTARAFGIFAAVSVVRFRTNIRDPKEVTVLLISLAIGLATGVGRWDLALVLAIFALLLLWVLEYREPEHVFRAMDLKIGTRNVHSTQEVLRKVIGGHTFDAELRAIALPKGEDQPGSLVYSVDVSSAVSTDELSEEILAGDVENVESIEWDQKKSARLYE
jgi:uncharacterized membrane protein YhiD involved in acid resistance